jgi:hypothetical protein
MLNVNYSECRKQACYAQCHNAECHYTECCYAECRGAQLTLYRIMKLKNIENLKS